MRTAVGQACDLANSTPRLLLALLCSTLIQAGDVTILSQNAWFDDESGRSGRYGLLLHDLAMANADVIALQEVTPTLLALIDRQANERGWNVAADRERIAAGYGNVTLSKHPLIDSQRIALPSRMSRGALVTTLTTKDRTLRVVNIHLDSMPEDVERRVLQLQTVRKLQTDGAWILVGDCNFGDGDREGAALAGLIDAGATDPTATYDIVTNAFAARTHFPDEPSRRLDRILVPAGTVIDGYRLIRTAHSDHYGIMAVLRGDGVKGATPPSR